ncbi:glycerate kinase [Saccharopolyspora mangrovi]|uniref:glycerate kinase n=1 Tax=Saccharopolyspora mangrovi TaxID=3082379 RepID=UPI00389A2373
MGEGRLDSQSTDGKIIAALLARASRLRRFAVVGSVGDDLADMASEFDQVLVASDESARVEAGRAIALRLRASAARRGQLG